MSGRWRTTADGHPSVGATHTSLGVERGDDGPSTGGCVATWTERPLARSWTRRRLPGSSHRRIRVADVIDARDERQRLRDGHAALLAVLADAGLADT